MVKLLANFFVQYYPVLMQRGPRNICLILVLAAACLPSPAVAAALTMDCTVGFNRHYQLDHWSPLSVVVENRGPAVRGRLEVVVTSGSEYLGDVYHSVYATEADLPPESVKRYQFTVKIKSFTHDLVIRLRQNHKVILSRSVNLRSRFTEKSLAVVVEDFVAPDILAVLPDQLQPVNVRPQFLPDTWYGYDSVKLLIMGADTISRLAEKQYQALHIWLRQGGYLVIPSDLNYGSLREKRIQDILPIKVSGYQKLVELKSLAQFCNQPLSAAEPFLVLDAGIEGSSILLQEKDIPIITRKDLGAGRIVFLSFDVNAPPFSRWEGRPLFWNNILSLHSAATGQVLKLDDQKILDSMLAGMPLKFPDFKWGVIFVAGYLIFLRVLLKIIGKPGRRRWRYGLGLLVMIILFTAIGYRGFYRPNLSQKLTYNTFCRLEVSGGDVPAYAGIIIGIYALQQAAYAFNFGPGAYPVRPLLFQGSRTKLPDPYVLQAGGGRQEIAGSLGRWSHSFYRLKLNFDSPLTGSAQRDDSFLTLKVKNTLPHNVVDCLVYYNRRFVFVDDILANAQQVVKLSLADLRATEFFNDQEAEKTARQLEERGGSDFLRSARTNLTKDLMLEIHKKFRSQADRVILIGWMPAGLIQPEFYPAGPTGTGLTMICWQLPVETAL